jgi:cyclophilin family peptidyl-prolyl cis-trans isomerase
MKNLGSFTVQLLTEDAPVTVATFASLADKGQYNDTTFHRFAANFVIQGGSPGADEMDGATAHFMRDEVGLVRHLRGTLGISTRGHDTGDGQIFVNLVDNVRLDDQYTVFARVIEGMDVVDRVLEGDVITSITIERRK